jgi:hypothetical protein
MKLAGDTQGAVPQDGQSQHKFMTFGLMKPSV